VAHEQSPITWIDKELQKTLTSDILVRAYINASDASTTGKEI
jgi:hypothetical protein